MFGALRNKILSLTKTQRNILRMILILLNLGIIIFWIGLWFRVSKKTPQLPPREKVILEKQLKELHRLRQQGDSQPFTSEQIQRQIEELKKLRSQ